MKRVQAITITLFAVLVAASDRQANARDDALIPAGAERTAILVDHMPPVMRAAYLKGIRDELIAHGYDPGPESNAFDDRFTTAIQRYQLDAGLRPDGVASKELLEHLLFALPKVYADGSRGFAIRAARPESGRIALAPATRPLRQPDEEPVPSPAPRGRVSARPLPDAGGGAKHLFPRPNAGRAFRAQSAGPGGFVSRTQHALRDRGYYHGPIDGRFSDGLAAAIRAFQKNNRLPVTGVIDGPLLAALS